MKKETFERKQVEKFEKFLEKFVKEKEKENFIQNNFLFCKYKEGYLFGDQTHFEYAKVADIAENLKQYERDAYVNILKTWERNFSFSSAEKEEKVTRDGKLKVYKLSNAYGFTYIQKKFFPNIPERCVFKTCTTNTKKYPVKIEIDGIDYAYILPININADL